MGEKSGFVVDGNVILFYDLCSFYIVSIIFDVDTLNDTEYECRVCRVGAEPDHPLFSPCLCSGSIMFCHQDCLEEWLKHSRKDHCELCNSQYTFIPLYAENAPAIVPIRYLVASSLRRFFFELFPYSIRIIVAATLWLIVLPISTSWLHRFWIHGRKTLVVSDLTVLWNDVVAGLILAAVIALSFIVLVRPKNYHSLQLVINLFCKHFPTAVLRRFPAVPMEY